MTENIEYRKSKIILAVCSNGPRFEPNKKSEAEGANLENYLSKKMPLTPQQVIDEAIELQKLGVRYIHTHSRNPETSRQNAEPDWYKKVNIGIRQATALSGGMVTSNGTSRFGPEVGNTIAEEGEIGRSKHITISPKNGGPDLGNFAAASEISAIEHADCSKDTNEFRNNPAYQQTTVILDDTNDPDGKKRKNLKVTSTGQYEYLQEVTRKMAENSVGFEIEFTTWPKSLELLKFILEDENITTPKNMNVVLLFGFTKGLKQPESFSEFREKIDTIKALEFDSNGNKRISFSIIAGSVVRPNENLTLAALDNTIENSPQVNQIERVIDYACRDERVTGIRVGIEDCPFRLNEQGEKSPADNISMATEALALIEKKGVKVETNIKNVKYSFGVAPPKVKKPDNSNSRTL